MAAPDDGEKPIVISTDDVRGAQGPKDGTRGDTLVPMLIGAGVLTAIGIFIAAMVVI